ncbi:hypothetical protein MHYP_G00065680 [Metynnis hypsauchen]
MNARVATNTFNRWGLHVNGNVFVYWDIGGGSVQCSGGILSMHQVALSQGGSRGCCSQSSYSYSFSVLRRDPVEMFLYIFGLVVFYYVYRWYKELKRVPNKSEKYVYITGCDTGFGNLLAKHLDTLGFCVIAGCYTEKGEDELKKACSPRLCTVQLDVTDNESIKKATDAIKALVGDRGLWAVVNNAGVSVPSAPNDWLVIDDFKHMINVNLLGVIAVTQSVLPLIKKAKGRVVNVASVFGRLSPVGGPYCISKYGVEAFNDSLRMNMAPFGVKVLCIEPGFFKTSVTDINLLQSNFQKLWDRLPQDVRDDYGSDYVDCMKVMMKERFVKMLDGDLMKVVSCMEHAVSAVHPRTRYSAGWDAKFFWLPLSYMPSCIADALLLKDVKPKLQADIKEYFLGYIDVEQTTGLNLSNVVLDKLKELGIPFENCRGQAYDNGGNMKGKKQGVQA